MAGVGKWVEEIRRKLGEWAQALEEQLAPQADPELAPVRVPSGGRRRGTPYPPERR
jgi:hypothetical protein